MRHSSRPPLRSIEIAVVVGECGSISAAADALGVTHGAVSRHVKALEQAVGVQLFDRHGRGVRPTPEGERYLVQVSRSLAAIAEASERWRGQRGTSIVRVSVTPSFAQIWLLDRIRSIESGDPPLRIEIDASGRLADLEGGETDCVIRHSTPDLMPVGAELLLPLDLYPVAGPGIAERLGLSPTPEAIRGHPLLHTLDLREWRAWSAATAEQPLPRDRRFAQHTMALEAARAGLGVALAQAPVSDAAVRRLGLRRLGTRTVRSPYAYFAIARGGKAQPAVGVFLQRLRAELSVDAVDRG
ncbi:MAG: LysR family transcriptional regulator [Gammaproteobacteria bacterium]|uniref:LysR family transcriptional regulator n=1 Tax=Thalassobaculum sp. TaxID=2022740 RepID=UPI0032EE0DDF